MKKRGAWTCLREGGLVYRTRSDLGGVGFAGEARVGEFKTDHCLTEPAGDHVWFTFASTAEEAIAKLRAEIFETAIAMVKDSFVKVEGAHGNPELVRDSGRGDAAAGQVPIGEAVPNNGHPACDAVLGSAVDAPRDCGAVPGDRPIPDLAKLGGADPDAGHT